MQQPSNTEGPADPPSPFLDVDLQIIFGISLTAIIGVFAIAPALPSIVKALQISSADVGWLITIFSLPGIFLMPLAGACADRIGRKKVVGGALFLFAACGGACFFVHDFRTLLVLRFFQGVGAAPLSSLNIALISDLYDGDRRTAAMGYNQAVVSIGAASLMALGGGLAALGWRNPFLLAFLGAPVGFMVLFRLKSVQPETPPPLRAYLGGVTRALTNFQIISIYLLVILGLLMVWGSYMSYLPVLMGLKLQQGPAVIGAVMTTMMVFSAIASSQMGRLAKRFSGRDLFKLCFTLYGVALLLIPFVRKAWLLLFPLAVFGTAQGIFIPNLQSFLGRLSTLENRGVVMSLYGSALRIGQSLGPFIMGLLFPLVGIDGIFFVCAGLSLALGVGAAALIDRPSAIGSVRRGGGHRNRG